MKRKFCLTIVRHGETELNKRKVLQGHFDEPLNEMGKAQSIHLGKHICNERFSHVFTSDLKRASETCKLILLENLEFSSCRSLSEINFDARLRERTFGAMEGKPRSEWLKITRQHEKVNVAYVPEGGESQEDVRNRADSFFKSLCSMANKEFCDKNENLDINVLLVSHGGFIRILVMLLMEEYGCGSNNITFNRGILNASRSCFIISLPLLDDGGEGEHSGPQTQNGDWLSGVTIKCTCFNENAR